FQVMFTFQTNSDPELKLPGLSVQGLGVQAGTAKFDLSLDVLDEGGELTISLTYRTQLFDAQTIRHLLMHFQAVLEQITANPSIRLHDLELVSPEERRLLLGEFNNTLSDCDNRRGCIHELISAQAARTPDAAAVVFEEEQLSYRELIE